MLVSVHLPKTAGTSISEVLEKRFGDSYLKDYSDMPINTPVLERKRHAFNFALRVHESQFEKIECVHGHFLPLKYLLLAEQTPVKFVTWMREPVDRLVSHFYFWKRSYTPERSGHLHRRVVEEDWSIEKFCFSEEMKDIYSQFLFGFPLEYFSFIGIMEYFEIDFEYFKRTYLGLNIELNRLNVGNSDGRYQLDDGFRNAVEEFHSKDVELYRRAIEYRNSRIYI